MGGLGAKKEELVPKRSALRKEKGAGKAEGEDPGCRKDLESGGRSRRSESCVEMNASDAKGWYPKAAENRPDFLHDCPGAATASWREGQSGSGEPSAAGRARVSAWNNQVGRKLSSWWSLNQPQRPDAPQTVVFCLTCDNSLPGCPCWIPSTLHLSSYPSAKFCIKSLHFKSLRCL